MLLGRLKHLLIAGISGGLLCVHPLAHAYEHDNAPEEVRRIHGFIEQVSADTIANHTQQLMQLDVAGKVKWAQSNFSKLAEGCTANVTVAKLADQSGNKLGVYAYQKGILDPKRVLAVTGVASRSDAADSGIAGLTEALRVICQTRFPGGLVYAVLKEGSGSSDLLHKVFSTNDWRVMGVLSVTDIANVKGVNGEYSSLNVRLFSEGVKHSILNQNQTISGSMSDSPSRSYARLVDRLARQYFPHLDAKLVYRAEEVGASGHHLDFNALGYPAFAMKPALTAGPDRKPDYHYAAKLSALLATTLASHGGSPPFPVELQVSDQYPLTLSWDLRGSPLENANLRGWRVYWRETSSSVWQHSRYLTEDERSFTFEGLDPNNVFVGVAAVANDGLESPVVYPGELGQFDTLD